MGKRQCSVNQSFNKPSPLRPFVPGNAGGPKTPRRFPVCQGSQIHTPNPTKKKRQKIRGTQDVRIVRNAALGRREGRQKMLPEEGKYWNWNFGDQQKSTSRATAGEKVFLAQETLGQGLHPFFAY